MNAAALAPLSDRTVVRAQIKRGRRSAGDDACVSVSRQATQTLAKSRISLVRLQESKLIDISV